MAENTVSQVAPADVAERGLREFLTHYEQEHPHEVLHIDKPLDLDEGVTALFAQLERARRFPILWIHRPTWHGTGFDMPLITGTFSSRNRLARLMGVDGTHVAQEYGRRLGLPQAPVVVPRDQAPVKQVVATGDAANVLQFPAPRHHAMDPGRYLTVGFLTTYDPDTQQENSAIHRGWLFGPREVRVFVTRVTHNAAIYRKYEDRGQPMPVAYWVGHHPLAVLGAESRTGLGHWEAAGAILQSPLRLVPSETLGEQFMVPADAEVVIEGFIPPHERRPEGPFGEYPEYYGPQHLNPVMQVTAVTHRRQPLWDDVMVGHTHWVGGFQREGSALAAIRRVVPTTLNTYLPMSGCKAFHLYVQIRQTAPGQAKSALLAALNIDPLIKHALVFDEDIDIFDEREVMWALATRFQGDKDLVVIPGTVGPTLDPSAAIDSVGCKVGFDCTKPADAPFARRLDVSAKAMEQFQLEDFLSDAVVGRVPEDHFA